ncbi:ankyrin repeat domain-containing protein 50 [Alosa sapidissima]|uniref:ankyrin repeat domain-containing protein 50 n=1 Tax=Alosa sapidissima TaxID=34773 RepID=UPI001C093284|nr:ankyrin repeat domain-containing protein 50 [Alosa sapidissima]XP_041930426.1 ankyrin repeat domain-containing protein 50 [Alosa sapidissima]XP_041930427.1 ankyrin repeat domain-containing protein 50 [Alosa sapidissima]
MRNSLNSSSYLTMAQTSLLQGKRFYCREWVFHKIQHCLQEKTNSLGNVTGSTPSKQAVPTAGGPPNPIGGGSGGGAAAGSGKGAAWGVLLVGGPGSGKTALCTELLWPSSPQGLHRGLHQQSLAFHFCRADDSDTLCVSGFIRGLVAQICRGGLVPGYEEKVRDPAVQSALQPGECERNPTEAFKRCVLLPLLSAKPPPQALFLLVDSIDEGCQLGESEQRVASGSPRTIAELLASHHEFLPPWLLLVCSARRQNKAITKLFTGFRKISLDDLRKAYIVKDVQQYILHRLDQEEALRQHLTKETAEMLNQLHIKSSGCFLYLERVLDGVVESFIMLREIRDIPGTLNGLYLWLCQRLFVRKQFAKVQPILNVMLAACRPLTVKELYHAVWTKNMTLNMEEFQKKMDILSKLLVDGLNNTKILFHYSFAEWLLDVKHCTQKYLCNAAEGHRMMAMSYTCRAKQLKPLEVQEFALHLINSNLQIEPFNLALWMVWNGTPAKDSLSTSIPKEQEVLQLLVKAGAHVNNEDDHASCIVQQALEREDSIRTLLDNGASVNQADSCGRTLLANAAYSGNLDVVNLLITRRANMELEDNHGQTPLTLAARQGHTKVVNCLIGFEANINHTDHDGWTALRSAAWGGHSEVVSALLYAGAKVDCADADGRTALRAAAWGGHEDIVLNLLQHGAEVNKADNEGRTALIAAAYMGHREIVEHLLDHGAEVNHEDVDGRTALSVAALCVPASKGHASVVSLLIDRGAEVDHCDKDCMTPLLVAAYEGHVDVVDLLLEGGADVDHTDNNGRTPLLAAASMGHASVVNTLLFWGAAVDSIDSEGRTVLSIASAQGNVEVVRTLLDRGLDENHRDDAGWTPLHMASFEGHRQVCDALLEQGARCTEVDNDGRIPLILAAQEGHYDCVHILLENKSCLDQRGYDGRNSLRVAALEGHRDIVELLLSHGADIDYKDADGRPTLYILALENQLAMAEYFLENGANVEASDTEGRTALHVSCWQGHVEMVRMLINYHADVNACDNEKRSALQSAAWQGHAKVVQFLIDNGTHVDHTCNQGATALGIAAQEGHIDVVQILLEHGADPNHADQFGRTAMRVAAKGGHTMIIKLLEKYGASSLNGCNPSPIHTMEQKTPLTVSGKMQSLTIKSNSSGSTGAGDMQSTGRGLQNGPVHAFSSPSESPDSTVDRQKSSLSNNSLKSSKNSSLRTTSSTATAQTVPIDSFHGLSFTEQIQQHSLPRSRSRQSIVSPSSTTKSIGPQPSSPTSEFDWGQIKPGLKQSKGTKNSTSNCSNKMGSGDKKKSKNSGPAQGQVLEYEMTQFDKRIALNNPVSNIGIKDPHCKIVVGGPMLDSGQTQEQYYIQQQSLAEKKRNGIMTNPNYHLQGNQVFLGRVSVPRTLQNRGHQDVLDNYPIGETELSLKQALKLQIEGSDPGYNYKKETPL